MVRAMLRAMASLRLSVALLTLAMALIFVGTLAQVREGVWEAVHTYFRAPIAWIELDLFVPSAAAALPLRVPLPGGAIAIGIPERPATSGAFSRSRKPCHRRQRSSCPKES